MQRRDSITHRPGSTEGETWGVRLETLRYVRLSWPLPGEVAAANAVMRTWRDTDIGD